MESRSSNSSSSQFLVPICPPTSDLTWVILAHTLEKLLIIALYHMPAWSYAHELHTKHPQYIRPHLWLYCIHYTAHKINPMHNTYILYHVHTAHAYYPICNVSFHAIPYIRTLHLINKLPYKMLHTHQPNTLLPTDAHAPPMHHNPLCHVCHIVSSTQLYTISHTLYTIINGNPLHSRMIVFQ